MNAESNASCEIFVKFNTEPSICISVDCDSSISQLKDLLQELFDVEPSNQKVIFRGKLLKNDSLSLHEVGIRSQETIYLLTTDDQLYLEKKRNALEHSANIPVSQVFGEGKGKSMLDDTFGSNGMAALMKSMMKSSAVKDMLMRPEMMEKMLMNDPRIQHMIEKNPEMRKMLTSPETMKEMIEMMTNPDYQKHVQKSVDRALINLNAMPGGFDALKQVYSMQKPLFEEKMETLPLPAVTHTASSNVFTKDTLPNPWSSDVSRKPSGAFNKNAMKGEFFNNQPSFPIGPFSSSAAPPDSNYEQQLSTLEEYGFLDKNKNIRALIRTQGNVDEAVEVLLEEMEKEQ